MTVILALETSCDDTCAAVVETPRSIRSNVVSSQDELHGKYQGVVPELASRRHCEVINGVIREALDRGSTDWNGLNSVAVTYGPGLIGSLLTGVAAAKSIAAGYDLDLIPVNHIKAHVYSVELEHSLEYPYIGLVASGGHTVLFEVTGDKSCFVLGHTRDDAAGEAYDKVAKMLDLGYPGGPEIQALAENGSPELDFPRPTLQGEKRWEWSLDEYDFSFSGLKTAVYYHLRDHPDSSASDVAASFQQAVNDVLIFKTLRAAKERDVPRVAVSGGVAANRDLRRRFHQRTEKDNLSVVFPSASLCTDNAAMIGYQAQSVSRRANMRLNAEPRLTEFTNKTAKGEGLRE